MSSDPVSTTSTAGNVTAAPSFDYAAIVESSEDAILSKDANGTITSWNPAAERLYGHSAEDAVGKRITLIIPPDRRGEEREILDKVLAGERVSHYETERMRKDGRRVHVSLTVSPIVGEDDAVVGASVVARDIGQAVAVRRRSELLHRFTSRLAREAEPGPAVRLMLTDGCELLGADAATVGMLADDGETVVLADSVGHTEEGLADWKEFPLDAEVPLCAAIRDSEPIWSSTAEELTERFPALRGARVRFAALAVLPLELEGGSVGAVAFSFREPRHFSGEERAFMRTVVQQAAHTLERARMYHREHETALTLQRGLLPESLPEVEGVEVAARYLPAEAGLEVGGDWYDVIEAVPGRLDLVIGDVAGRGVAAAAVMGRLTMALRAYIFDGRPVHAAVSSLDELMKAFHEPQMATLFHLSLDLEQKVGRFVRAGHPPALLRLPDKTVVELEGDGSPPLGLLEGARFTPNQFELPAAGMILLYTDGLIERRDEAITDGLERLKRAFATASSSPEEVVEQIPAAIGAERVPDDIALLAVCVDPD